jgi:hypothetical protein
MCLVYKYRALSTLGYPSRIPLSTSPQAIQLNISLSALKAFTSSLAHPLRVSLTSSGCLSVRNLERAGRSKSHLERRTQTDAVSTTEGRVKCVRTQIWTLEGGVLNVSVGNLEGGGTPPPSIF